MQGYPSTEDQFNYDLDIMLRLFTRCRLHLDLPHLCTAGVLGLLAGDKRYPAFLLGKILVFCGTSTIGAQQIAPVVG